MTAHFYNSNLFKQIGWMAITLVATATWSGCEVMARKSTGSNSTSSDSTSSTSTSTAATTSTATSTTSGTGTVAATASKISKTSGDAQTAAVGTTLSEALSVTVNSDSDAAVSNAKVNWTVGSGSATLSASSTQSNSSGVASVSVTLGSIVGNAEIVATLDGTSTSVTFTATATVGSAARISISSGADQSALPSSALGSSLVVQVSDNYGNAVTSGQTVSWAIGSGGGTLSAASSSTNSSGKAKVGLTVGSSTGANTVVASIASGAAVTFTATSTYCAGANLTAEPFATGLGTVGSPYILCTPAQLNRIGADANYVTKIFNLGKSIDMSGQG